LRSNLVYNKQSDSLHFILLAPACMGNTDNRINHKSRFLIRHTTIRFLVQNYENRSSYHKWRAKFWRPWLGNQKESEEVNALFQSRFSSLLTKFLWQAKRLV